MAARFFFFLQTHSLYHSLLNHLRFLKRFVSYFSFLLLYK